MLSIHRGIIYPALNLSMEAKGSLGMMLANSALLVLLCIPIYVFVEKPINRKLKMLNRAAEERERSKNDPTDP